PFSPAFAIMEPHIQVIQPSSATVPPRTAMHMPILTTERLVIRPLRMEDLDAVHQLLDVDLATADMGTQGPAGRADREHLLLWSTLNYQALETLYQPPYGDRAIELAETGGLIGLCGFVPCLAPFGLLPTFAGA